jgi:small subunit ribosomal protein S20
MPVTKSAKKALRQNQKRRKRNLLYKNKIKDLRKKIRKLVEEKKIKEAEALLPAFYKAVDKAAKENVIKKNTAARKKSRIVKFIAKAKTQKEKKSSSIKPKEK